MNDRWTDVRLRVLAEMGYDEIEDVSIDVRSLASSSARGSSLPEIFFVLDMDGSFDGYTAARSFLCPNLSPPPEGLPFTLSEILLRWMNDRLIDIRLLTFFTGRGPYPPLEGPGPPLEKDGHVAPACSRL